MRMGLIASTCLATLAACLVFASANVRAADVPAQGCSLRGEISGGVLFDTQSYDMSIRGSDLNAHNTQWNNGFGEAAGLVSCDSWNIQADVAY